MLQFPITVESQAPVPPEEKLPKTVVPVAPGYIMLQVPISLKFSGPLGKAGPPELFLCPITTEPPPEAEM